MENKATAVVIASTDVALATDLSNIMSSVTFRVFTTKDVIGLEVCLIRCVVFLRDQADICASHQLGTGRRLRLAGGLGQVP